MPSPKKVDDLKLHILHPSTTSHFQVEIAAPRFVRNNSNYFSQNGVNFGNGDKLNLLCCEATLPGSNLATLELTNDHTGVTERHAYRRIYDDRIDLTFYVDAENYLPITFFETWMKYISQESVSEGAKPSSRSDNYYYTFQYSDNYSSTGLKVVKFERSSRGYASGVKGKPAGSFSYEFIKSFPISIASMPVSYDSSSLLKCTVSMTYLRYVVAQVRQPDEQPNNTINYQKLALENPSSLYDPEVQSKLNGLSLSPINANLGNYDFSKVQSIDITKTFGASSSLSLF